MGKTTTIALPFDQGLSQQEAVEWLDSGASASGILNGNFTKQNAVDKRLGMGLISLGTQIAGAGRPDVGTLATGIRCTSWSRGALAAAGIDSNSNGALFGVRDVPPAAGQNLVPLGPLPRPRVIRRGLPSSSSTNTQSISTVPSLCDVPSGTSFNRFAFYVQGATTWMSITDANTGGLVQAPTQVYAGAPASISAVCCTSTSSGISSVAVMLFFPGSPGSIVGLSVTAAGVATTQLAPFAVNSADIAPWVGHPAGDFYLLYELASGSVVAQDMSPTWTFNHATVLETVTPNTFPLQVVANYSSAGSETIAFLYYGGGGPGNIRFASIKGDGSYASVVAPETIASLNGAVVRGLARVAAGAFFVSWVHAIATTGFTTTIGEYGRVSAAGAYTSEGVMPLTAVPVAKAFVVGSTVYQACCCQMAPSGNPGSSTPTSEQVSLYLLAFPTLTLPRIPLPVASVAVRQVDPFFIGTPTTSLSQYVLPCMSQQNAASITRAALGLKTLGSDIPAIGQSFGPTWAADFFFDAANQALNHQCAEWAGALVIAGAVPMTCDGMQTTELGYFYYPEFLVAAAAAGSVSLTGTYTWAAVLERTDAAGQMTRSSPVFSNSVTLAAQAAQISIPNLSMTYGDLLNPGQVQVAIYRTVAGGSTFFLLGKQSNSGVPSASTFLFSDNVTDAQAAVSTILYTTGGILDSVNPPAATCLCLHANRLWIVDETLRQIWPTNAFSPGLAPSFNEALVIPFPADITGLFSLDDKLIIGTLDRLYVIYGQGPDVTGQGSDLTPPQPIACDAGPVDWRAGCVFPGGLLFRSPTGIMLCDRGLNVSWVGKDVTDTLALYPTVLSSTLVPTATQVRFVCENAAGLTVTLCYDYLASKWVQHTYAQQNTGVADSCMARATASHGASFAVLTQAGGLYQEHIPSDAAPWLDDDSTGAPHFVPTTVTPAWIKVQGVQGYQRARFAQLFFEDLDDCGITMALASNYDATAVQSNTWPSSVVDDLPNNIVHMHVGADIAMQAALQVSVSDVAGANVTTGRGARFVALNVELEQIDSSYRQLPPAGRA